MADADPAHHGAAWPGAPAGLILAGGQGRRMGGADKALLELGEETLIARAARRLAPQVGAVAIGANGDPGRFGLDLPVLADTVGGGAGPLAGVLAGLDWAAGAGFDSLATVAVDTPFVPLDLVARLGAAGAPSLAATGGRTHPTCALWPVALRDPLRAWLGRGERKVMLFAQAAGARTVPFPDPAAFFNINTPDDLATARSMAAP